MVVEIQGILGESPHHVIVIIFKIVRTIFKLFKSNVYVMFKL